MSTPSFEPILSLDLLGECSAEERAGFWPGLECGEIFGWLQSRPAEAFRYHMAPHKFQGIVPELLLRMAESLNRPFRTELSSLFKDAETEEPWVEFVFGPSDPVPDWLRAKLDRHDEEGKANG